MAAVIVSIAGRTYRLSCDDGEEPRLEQLARYVESKILSMKDGFKEIGEQRIVVMAALAIADEATDARGKAQAMEMDIAALRAELDSVKKAAAALEERVSGAVEDAARRIEQLNTELQKPSVKDDFPV
ncbi:cell division protein ZapA [Methylocystis parvus]|uniref:Cell division protein ZapA n=1 Tax=Methylocystis parvus TaxID=134 RepID=A0A6B8M4Z1_9HYPH|nr:cell division protein ZapA [Methylocystis parvus]QGM96839.1 cell division protein ZapA [Methylocystis parvus]WBJ99281.1 cell division protein ZapA [Methylocystis parvus OBBP]